MGISAYRESSGTVWGRSWNQTGKANSRYLCDLLPRSQALPFIPKPWAGRLLSFWYSWCINKPRSGGGARKTLQVRQDLGAGSIHLWLSRE